MQDSTTTLKAAEADNIDNQSSSVAGGCDLPLEGILEACGLTVTGTHELPGHKAELTDVPSALHPALKNSLEQAYPKGLYTHQAKAIEAHLDGSDVCLATGTASGKSLVFMAAAANRLLANPQARVLVMYPVRALIQDQLSKWETLTQSLNVGVGRIDGSVPMAQRKEILMRKRVVLMTPDVAHAWFMSHLSDPVVTEFRSNLELLILDEAHVYEGVFGTNMAFFMRRLQAVCGTHQLICSTATLGEASNFVKELTGRSTVLVGHEDDGAATPAKRIVAVRPPDKDGFEAAAKVVKLLGQGYPGRFLVFSDSRKMVETVTAASLRKESSEPEHTEEIETALAECDGHCVLPYRAGYEAQDRRRIQQALGNGELRGVVSTSALELGLDIGEIDLVVMLSLPPSMKAFWQRLGRAGRRTRGSCLLIDAQRILQTGSDALRAYVERPLEPNWLYLGNKYAQYVNALCAAAEQEQIGEELNLAAFESLPSEFSDLLANELNPQQSIPADLYPLKQAAQAGPHHEFPLRSGIEKNFKVVTHKGEKKGELSFSQALREAYPGAVHYYMAEPYRVRTFNYRKGEIIVSRERSYTTKPVAQVMVFPDLLNGVKNLAKGSSGFVAEAEMQVSERVTGFRERRGQTETTHNYTSGSPFYQQPLTRFIRTTSVCWLFEDDALMGEATASSVLNAFCLEHGIQPRELGVGRFHARQSPSGTGPVSGVCIYDNTNGSLRLTQRLVEHFDSVVEAAASIEQSAGNDLLAEQLEALRKAISDLNVVASSAEAESDLLVAGAGGGNAQWVQLVAAGESAMLCSPAGCEEVTVLGHFYTPEGLKYQLAHPTTRWTVEVSKVEVIHGMTKTCLFNPMTGEVQESVAAA